MAIDFKFSDWPYGSSWQLGDPVDTLDVARRNAEFCINVRASGLELKHILEDSKNLPNMGDQTKLVWYGDFARFIAGNIVSCFFPHGVAVKL